jgi:hypothetical protein
VDSVLGGILVFAVIGGLLWSIWLIIRRSKRRTRRIDEQLRGEIVPTSSRLVIRTSHKENTAFAVFFGVFVGDGVEALVLGRIALGLVLIIGFGPFAILYVRRAVQRRPELVVDGDGISVGSPSNAIPWEEIEHVRLRERHLGFGLSLHELVFLPSPRAIHPGEITLQHEHLSMSWNDVAAAVQARFGRRILAE